ncbi:hypothetical protein TELCIR_21191, partial [Teladorsagia circumcincta]
AAIVERGELDNEDKVVYWLERANSHLIYYDYEKCAACIENALVFSNLNMELAGKLGKRTRFQQRDIAQLVLNTIALTEGGDDSSALSPSQLAVVLALYRLERRSEHCDELFMDMNRNGF